APAQLRGRARDGRPAALGTAQLLAQRRARPVAVPVLGPVAGDGGRLQRLGRVLLAVQRAPRDPAARARAYRASRIRRRNALTAARTPSRSLARLCVPLTVTTLRGGRARFGGIPNGSRAPCTTRTGTLTAS